MVVVQPVTDRTALAEEVVARRQTMLGEMIADWSPDDARTLLVLLRRLNDDMESRRDDTDVARPAATG